jgi:hypothetical protein
MWDHKIMGMPVTTSYSVPKGEVYVIGAQFKNILLHPWTYEVLKHGRTPLWTRHMAGVSEAERDRRKYGRC